MSVSMMLTAMLDASVNLAISSIVCMVKDVLVGNLRMILVRVCNYFISKGTNSRQEFQDCYSSVHTTVCTHIEHGVEFYIYELLYTHNNFIIPVISEAFIILLLT